MQNPNFVHLDATTLNGSVSDSLKADSPSKTFVNDTLNVALKSQLSAALTDGGSPTLAGLVENLGAVDIAANKDLSVRAFIANQVEPQVANDPAKKQAVDAELAKLSNSTTIGALLSLDAPINDAPLFQTEVRK